MLFENASCSAAAAIAAASAASLQTTFALVKPPTDKDPSEPSSSKRTPQKFRGSPAYNSPSDPASSQADPSQNPPEFRQQQSPFQASTSSPLHSSISENSNTFVYEPTSRSTESSSLNPSVPIEPSPPFGYYVVPDQAFSSIPTSAGISYEFVSENFQSDDESTEEEYEYDVSQDEDQNDEAKSTDEVADDGRNAASITEAMGDLKIELDAVAPYIKYQGKRDPQPDSVPEAEPIILNAVTEQSTIQIPPDMMPSDREAAAYFVYFFQNIHPYVPVLNSAQFYRQWQNDWASISPFLLDGIFACASMRMDGIAKGSKWLAVAARHEEACKHSSSLSIIQGMLLCLKAQESSPKRGYFYRSWMTLVSMIAMAKDLEIDQHYELHQSGQDCEDPETCGIKYRVWHMLFVLETMIGGPQGRSFLDFGVALDTVDFAIPKSLPGFNDFEMEISRQFTVFMRVVRNALISGRNHHSLRKKTKLWALDPIFTSHDKDFSLWFEDTPADLRVQFPDDGSPPTISSHFMANITCYHYLSLIMHHRAQIETLIAANDPAWNLHFALCHNAAQSMCRVQEVVLAQYGVEGLVHMQRGISFSIYSILTCVMLHLVSLFFPCFRRALYSLG